MLHLQVGDGEKRVQGINPHSFLFSLDRNLLSKYDQFTVWMQSQYKRATLVSCLVSVEIQTVYQHDHRERNFRKQCIYAIYIDQRILFFHKVYKTYYKYECFDLHISKNKPHTLFLCFAPTSRDIVTSARQSQTK